MTIRQDGAENRDKVYCVYTFLKGEIEDLTVTLVLSVFDIIDTGTGTFRMGTESCCYTVIALNLLDHFFVLY